MGAKTKQLKGRIKQAAGTVTGNDNLEREGRVDRRSGETMARLDEATDKVEKVIDKASTAVTEAIHIGREGAATHVANRQKRSPHCGVTRSTTSTSWASSPGSCLEPLLASSPKPDPGSRGAASSQQGS